MQASESALLSLHIQCSRRIIAIDLCKNAYTIDVFFNNFSSQLFMHFTESKITFKIESRPCKSLVIRFCLFVCLFVCFCFCFFICLHLSLFSLIFWFSLLCFFCSFVPSSVQWWLELLQMNFFRIHCSVLLDAWFLCVICTHCRPTYLSLTFYKSPSNSSLRRHDIQVNTAHSVDTKIMSTSDSKVLRRKARGFLRFELRYNDEI